MKGIVYEGNSFMRIYGRGNGIGKVQMHEKHWPVKVILSFIFILLTFTNAILSYELMNGVDVVG